jgi:hypothetical protein
MAWRPYCVSRLEFPSLSGERDSKLRKPIGRLVDTIQEEVLFKRLLRRSRRLWEPGRRGWLGAQTQNPDWLAQVLLQLLLTHPGL